MIPMFEVPTYDVCPATGITSFRIKWDLGHGTKEDSGSFTDRRDADRYILSSKRSYILFMFDKYVNHARILFERGRPEIYRTEPKLASLEKCTLYSSWFQDKSFEAIIRIIPALEEHLRRILPSPGNPSYSSSESRIADMMVFCKRELKAFPTTQPVTK